MYITNRYTFNIITRKEFLPLAQSRQTFPSIVHTAPPQFPVICKQRFGSSKVSVASKENNEEHE